MALISFSTPSLVSGVSQQPDPLRFSTQAEKQENAYSSIVDGLTKRAPTNHLAQMVSGSTYDSCKVHPINRDTSERYLVLYKQNEVKVWDIVANTERTVYGPGQSTPDFSYINQLDVSRLRSVTVADTTFICNPDVETSLASTTSAGLSTGGLVFIKAGNYNTDYRIELGLYTDGSLVNYLPVTVEASTWDGSTSGNAKNIWFISLTSGTNLKAGTYSVDVLGDTASYTTATNPSAFTIRNALTSALNAINGITASSNSSGITISSDYRGLDIRAENLTNPTTGTGNTIVWSLTETQSHTENTLDSIQTKDIALELSTKLFNTNQVPSYVNTIGNVNTSVIEIDATYGIAYLNVSDGQGNTTMTAANNKVSAISELPTVGPDGFKIEIEGDPDAGEDNYYVEFETDGIATFGPGVWKEAVGPSVKTNLLESTMPHKLVRKFSGSTPYFEFGPVTYVTRQVGDDSTNPAPSFVGNTINDMFLFRGRLGFLADDNVILSEVNNFENFWRTTTTILAESDPIDIGISHPQVSILHSAVQWNEKLVMFSDQNQFVLEGEPFLTPQTAQISAITGYENISSTRPISNGRSIAFPYLQGDYSGVRELYQAAQDVYDAEDTTQPVPSYLEGQIVEMAATTVDGALVCLTSGERSSLYVFKTFYQGQERAQAAWSKYTFGSGTEIRSVAFIDTTLYMVVVRDQGLFLESLEFGPNQQDDDSAFQVRLDRRVADNSAGVSSSYSAGNNWTTITLPYNVAAGRTYKVVRRATVAGGEAGEEFTVVSTPSGSNIKVSGDITSEPFWVGEQYTMDYQFSVPRLREAARTPGGRGTVATGRQQIKFGNIVYDTSRYFQVDVTPEGRSTSTVTFTDDALEDGVFRFPIRSKNDQVTVRLHNDSHLPSNIISIEWEADFNTINSRYRG